MHLLRYTLLRVALLLASVAVLYLLGMRSWLLWGAAIVVAALLSYVLLPRQRDQAALDIARTVERRRSAPRRDPDADYEDAAVEGADGEGDGEAGRPDAGDDAR